MEYRTLGQTDLLVSTICLGTMQFGWTADKLTSYAIMSEFTEQGGNFFDTADVYSFWADDNPGGVSEQWIGDWIRQSNIPRDELFVATKAGLRMWDGPDGVGLGRKHLVRAVEDSLRRLQVETIDLYQAHWPDEKTPIEETLRAFDDMVQQGKVRYLGCSNYGFAQLDAALTTSLEHGLNRFVSLQPHYNMMRRINYEGELMDLCQRENIGVIPYSSLERGFLTGKYRKDRPIPEKAWESKSLPQCFTDQGFAVIEALVDIAKSHGTTVPQIAIAWLLANPGITSAIIGASSVDQLRETVGQKFATLSTAEKDALDRETAWTAREEIPRTGMMQLLDESL